MFMTKRKKIKLLEASLAEVTALKNEVLSANVKLADALADMRSKYPFDIGQVVYDVQLRSSKGRFTKTKASREHSYINEVVVDKKNYFNLVDRLAGNDVFTNKTAAEAFIADVCVE